MKNKFNRNKKKNKKTKTVIKIMRRNYFICYKSKCFNRDMRILRWIDLVTAHQLGTLLACYLDLVFKNNSDSRGYLSHFRSGINIYTYECILNRTTQVFNIVNHKNLKYFMHENIVYGNLTYFISLLGRCPDHRAYYM